MSDIRFVFVQGTALASVDTLCFRFPLILNHLLLDKTEETETCMVQACHTPRQPLQNHPSEHFGGWATLWSAEEMLDGQHQGADGLAHDRAIHKGLLQRGLEEDLCLLVPHVSPATQSVKELN